MRGCSRSERVLYRPSWICTQDRGESDHSKRASHESNRERVDGLFDQSVTPSKLTDAS